MPVKIRLMRIGAKKRPFYRVVAVDEQRKRTGGYLELLGTYNPLTEPKEIILKADRVEYWLKVGAVPSDGFLRITGKAPQRPPRKAKKEKQVKVAPQPKEEVAEPKDESVAADAESINGGEAKLEVEESATPVEEAAVGDPLVRSQESTASEVATSEDAPEIPEGQDPQGEEATPEEVTPEAEPTEEKPEVTEEK